MVSALVVFPPSVRLLGENLSLLLFLKLPFGRLGSHRLCRTFIWIVTETSCIFTIVNCLQAQIRLVNSVALLTRPNVSDTLSGFVVQLLPLDHLLLHFGDVTGIEVKWDLFVVGGRRCLGGLGCLSLASVRGLHSYFVGAWKDAGKVNAPVNNRVHGIPHFVPFQFLRSLPLAILLSDFVEVWSFTQETSLTLLVGCQIPHVLAKITHIVL